MAMRPFMGQLDPEVEGRGGADEGDEGEHGRP